MRNTILFSIIAVAFAGGLFSIAYAGPVLTTITLAGNVVIPDGTLSIGTNDGTNDDSIFFDDGTKIQRWDDSIDRFENSDDLAINGILEVGIDTEGVSQFQSTYNRLGASTTSHGLVDSNDVLVAGEFEVNGDSFFDNGLTSTTITAADFEYSTPQMKTMMFSSSEFQPANSGTTYSEDSSGNRFVTSGLTSLIAPVHTIPDGATLDQWQFFVIDNSASFSITCNLKHKSDAGGVATLFGAVSSTINSPAVQKLIINPGGLFIVDRDIRSYYMTCAASSAACGSACRIVGASIDFEVVSLD